jgi:hypothetical protein
MPTLVHIRTYWNPNYFVPCLELHKEPETHLVPGRSLDKEEDQTKASSTNTETKENQSTANSTDIMLLGQIRGPDKGKLNEHRDKREPVNGKLDRHRDKTMHAGRSLLLSYATHSSKKKKILF